MRVTTRLSEAPTRHQTYAERWEGPDGGLIAAWRQGLLMRDPRPDWARSASRDELPELPWRGGGSEVIKGKRQGTWLYLAMWQGLRSEALDVDTSQPLELRCTLTGVLTQFRAGPP
jgi:hypothetical protein